MYSKETLKSYLERMEATIKWYALFPVDSLEVAVSEGNVKVDDIPNVSLPPIFTCPHCNECKKECYDIKACLAYPSVMKARARNYSILKRNAELFWKQLHDKIRKLLNRKKGMQFFRFEVGGDIISKSYFEGMIKTARLFPTVTFWTYTKAHSIVNKYVQEHGGSKAEAIPRNLSVMFSRWEGMTTENPYGFGEFIAIGKDETPPAGAWKCIGNCRKCAELKRGCPVNETAWCYKH